MTNGVEMVIKESTTLCFRRLLSQEHRLFTAALIFRTLLLIPNGQFIQVYEM